MAATRIDPEEFAEVELLHIWVESSNTRFDLMDVLEQDAYSYLAEECERHAEEESQAAKDAHNDFLYEQHLDRKMGL